MSLIAYVTRIHFANRVLEDALPEELRKLSLSRLLILTDTAGEVDDSFDRVVDALPYGVTHHALRHVPAPPVAEDARAAAECAATQGCDGLVALGGPSVLALARAAGQVAGLPVVALPTTTAGVGLGPMPLPFGPAAVPALILCDPTLTLGASAQATAAAGMDALTHCLEAYLGTTWNPPADGIALDGLRRASDHLERAVTSGQDLGARREMLAAALNAGLAAQKGLGGVHALAHALEAEAGMTAPHGSFHAALLPPVMAFNAPAIADRLEALAWALRLPARADLARADLAHPTFACADVAGAVAALGARVGLPRHLAGLGLDRQALGRVARAAAEDAANRTNPRHATAADYLAMLEAAD